MLRQSLSLKMRSKRKGWVWPISSGLTFDLYKTNIVLFFTRSGVKFDPTNVSKNLFFSFLQISTENSKVSNIDLSK